MRLLNAVTMKLHSFQEGKTPDYVILSHTWHDDEVLFEDLQDISRASKKAGFAKIRFCCNQALKDHVKFVWIDTCCIDKTSSTELSEAINSMYRWYREAIECYAYLIDVSISADWEAEMVHSRWFKRAWTLQELLAPRWLLTFYSTEWNKIGTCRNLRTVVSKATGIDEEYLPGVLSRDIHTASVAKRMSWAAKRKATRTEDIAYSLFGIFNVNMPLLYGEGQQKAFRRLQEEIMKSSDDHTLFAWKTLPDDDHNTFLARKFIAPYRILAYSPAEFIDSGDLIPIEKNQQKRDLAVSPYSMTNIGLRISLPLNFGTGSGVVMAALNCRAERDFFHVLGLRLHRVGPKQFARSAEEGPIHLPTETLSSFVMEELYIQSKQDVLHDLDKRHLAFIFRKLPGAVRLLEVSPSWAWNSNDKILQGIFGPPSVYQSWHACLHLESTTESGPRHLVLILGVELCLIDLEGLGISHTPWDSGNSVARPWCALLDISLEIDFNTNIHRYLRDSNAPKEFAGFCEHDGVCVSFNDSRRDSDSLQPAFVDVIGQYMCVVDLTLCEEEEKVVEEQKRPELV